MNKELNESDYLAAAKLIGCEVAAIKAVVEVESRGAGFLDNGQPKILFEPHVFWRELINVKINPNNHLTGNSDILYKNWKRGSYGTISSQWGKMYRAIDISETAALKSASWGKFQIMGFNYKECGYSNIDEFVKDMVKSEYYHLLAFMSFCNSKRINGKTLTQWLREKNWAQFALGYNGEGYKANGYDKKMANFYNKFK